MSLELAEVHVQQATPVSCVAACVCMVRRRRGEGIEERALLEEWGSEGPFSLELHASELRDPDYPMHGIHPEARTSRDLLRSVLRNGQWVLISLVQEQRQYARHAVVLIDLNEDDQFLYLDPNEPLHAQPCAFSEDELVKQWTGEWVVCLPFA
jgi:hypothetical protein